MSTKRYKPEQIVNLLRKIEVEIANGKTTPQAAREVGITEQTYYRWRREFGGLKCDQAKRLKELEKENSRLKRLVAELSLEKQVLARWRRETAKPRAAAWCGGADARAVRAPTYPLRSYRISDTAFLIRQHRRVKGGFHSLAIEREDKNEPLSSSALFLGCLLGSGRRRAVALLGMQFRRFGVVMNCVLTVSVGEVGVVRGLFVLLGLLVFRCLFVMVGRALMMTRSVMVIFPSLRHRALLL